MINIYNGKMEGLVTSGTKIQMTYIQGRKTYLSLDFIYGKC